MEAANKVSRGKKMNDSGVKIERSKIDFFEPLAFFFRIWEGSMAPEGKDISRSRERVCFLDA